MKSSAAIALARADRDAARRADCLSFDDSAAGERIRQYEFRSHRKFLRTLKEFFDVRRSTDDIDCEVAFADAREREPQYSGYEAGPWDGPPAEYGMTTDNGDDPQMDSRPAESDDSPAIVIGAEILKTKPI